MRKPENTIGTSVPEMRSALRTHRFGWFEIVMLVVFVAVYYLLPGYLPLATQVAIMIIFAISLDLALGYGGIETLGHAVFYGIGGYAAGLYALHVWQEPISGLLVAAIAAGIFGIVSGVVVLRAKGLTLVMLTLACATMVHEFANSMRAVTGGDDGLSGYRIDPVFGLFRFDLFGRTAYIYSVCILVVVFLIARVVANSNFGLTARGIRSNAQRMQLLGVPVLNRLVLLYAISGALAGIAGALSAQVTKLVGLNTLAFTLSGNVLIVLILGGIGRLYGAVIGSIVFVVLSDRAAAIDPFNWLFILGGLIVLTVWLAPDGIAGRFSALTQQLRGRERKS
ncbi:branched-chain amino acid transport system permease protein [Xaviernesmea oryzae]|uniref:Branched-chain amino acid transport system permease protein n=1 Tax=Xaviernesmea oryzae TaxID=464029 RepID=A0A1X7DAQ7_9HYPH|nr:branched-chain amino acid ABC transporter permease [Xaviernesmea oryzae]SMF12025.1 branched-chain amino acid transport system permease protein [Xaviernesmea oryzae]